MITGLFLKLLNMSITASWLVLAILVVRSLFRKMPKWIRCFLWGVVALRLIFPFSLESPISLLPSAKVIPQDILASQTPAIYSGIPAVNNAVNPMLTQQTVREGVMLSEIISVIAAIWLIGTAALLLYSMFSYWQLRRKVRISLLQQTHIYLCDDIPSPFILGILRPKIYLPSGLTEDQTEYVLAHETAHISRRDHWWKPLGFLLLTVYWFNPLLWLAYILLCRDIEQACDEKVIAVMDNAKKKGYAEALVSCSAHRRMVMACPVAFGEVGVKARVKGILSYKKPGFWILLASVAVCVAVTVCFLTNPESCNHTYQKAVTVSSTCTEKGIETLTCTLCKHSYTAPADLLAHTYDEGTVTQAPTCIQAGTRKYCCTGCGTTKTESIDTVPHTADEIILTKEPNCTEKGESTATCTVCNASFVVAILEVNDVHDLQETVLRAASCAAAGEGVRRCTRCEYSESCTYEQLAHTYRDGTTVAATCSTHGRQQHICTGCNAEYWTETPLSTEHTWREVGFNWPDYCAFCGATRPNKNSQSYQGYSLIDELYQPPAAKTPEDILPVIRIWP